MTASASASSPDAVAERRRRKRERRVRWAVSLGLVVFRALARTWRFRLLADDPSCAAGRGPVLFVFWHGRMLPLLWHYRGRGIAIMISEHGDGEIVARVAKALGYETVRGSSSRGAERALIGGIRSVRDGRDLAVTPDGPRGPYESFAPGALVIAQRSGARLLLLAAGARRAWRLRSWDRFMIPKPFARVVVGHVPLMQLTEESARDAAAQTDRFREMLRALTASVDAAADA